jgi:putative dehydrogenase
VRFPCGIIGLGIMGGAIAPNLIERGWTVFGFDVDKEKTAVLAKRGVTIAAEVAHKARLIMTSLPSPAIAVGVAWEIAGFVAPERIVLELSTLAIADKNRFRDVLEASGHIALDCPLSGTGAQAANRDLVIYASGNSAAIAECAQLFAYFGKQSADLGTYGNGSKMKFIANHLVAINNVATAVAMGCWPSAPGSIYIR